MKGHLCNIIIASALVTGGILPGVARSEIVFEDSFARPDSQSLGCPDLGGCWMEENETYAPFQGGSYWQFQTVYPGDIVLANGVLTFHYPQHAGVTPRASAALTRSTTSATYSFEYRPSSNVAENSGRVEHIVGLMSGAEGFLPPPGCSPADFCRAYPVRGVGINILRSSYSYANSQVYIYVFDGVDQSGNVVISSTGQLLPFQFDAGGVYRFTVTIANDAVAATVTDGSQTFGISYPLAGFAFLADKLFLVDEQRGGDGLSFDNMLVNALDYNAPPTLESISASPSVVPVNSAVTVTANFTDPEATDTFAGTFEWNDGTTSAGVVDGTASAGTLAGTHVYTTPGVYTVAVTLADQAGGTAQSRYEYVVVYDPEAGFVTGGGWINSPAGAYAPDSTLAGKANFGFVSRYTHGTNVPTGDTEFNFRVANLNFHSISYDWLVISGARATYKGFGTINGAGSYRFLLSAIDGQVNGGGGTDRFRMRIWDAVNGGLVYDNHTGASDDASPSQAIAGGSIVIHQ